MPRVFIPPLLRPLAGGREQIDVAATTVRDALARADEQCPGLRERLCDGDDLKPGLTVAVDGRVGPLGLLEKLAPESEVHFLPAVGGG